MKKKTTIAQLSRVHYLFQCHYCYPTAFPIVIAFRFGFLLLGAGAARPTWRELDDDVMHNSIVIADSLDAAKVESGAIIMSKVGSTETFSEIENESACYVKS